MRPTSRPLFAVALALLSAVAPVSAPAAAPSSKPLEIRVAAQRARVDVVRGEIRETDARIEARLDRLLGALRAIGDTESSRSKVARMKEETGKSLIRSIDYYARKRAALQEELRNPRLLLSAEEKRQIIATFDARIEKRVQQVLALQRSMPAATKEDRYTARDGGWWGTEYSKNPAYRQSQRMSVHSDQQRDAIVERLDASIDRLDRQRRDLLAKRDAAVVPEQRAAWTEELGRTEALLEERRAQRLEALKPARAATRGVSAKEAADLDAALQSATAELRRDFETLFQRYNTLLVELSSLRANEALLAGAR
jgi:hypothetical protein